GERRREGRGLRLPGQRQGRPRRPPLHDPRLARRADVPVATSRIPLRVTLMQRDRRGFLKLCSLAGLSVAVPLRFPLPSRAEARNGPCEGLYSVVFNAGGGWDTTYLMDPKGTGGINRLYKEGDILTKGAHKYAPTAKHIKGGLSNEDFYAQFGDELLALN